MCRTCNGFQDVLGSPRTPPADPRLPLQCSHSLEARDAEHPGARLRLPGCVCVEEAS